jgi:hypothetical protein
LIGKLANGGISCLVGIYSEAGDCVSTLTGTSPIGIIGGELAAFSNCAPHLTQNAALSGLLDPQWVQIMIDLVLCFHDAFSLLQDIGTSTKGR